MIALLLIGDDSSATIYTSKQITRGRAMSQLTFTSSALNIEEVTVEFEYFAGSPATSWEPEEEACVEIECVMWGETNVFPIINEATMSELEKEVIEKYEEEGDFNNALHHWTNRQVA